MSHCQLRGYHREKTFDALPKLQAERCRRIFWTLYTIDKNVSLLVGRGPVLQDLDVDTSHPEVSSTEGLRPWDTSFCKFIELARIQGQIFARLYSSEAYKIPWQRRRQSAGELIAAVETWKVELDSVSMSNIENVFKAVARA